MEKSEPYVGQIVQVIDGPFTGFRGEVKAIDETVVVANVAVQIYGRITLVDLEPHQMVDCPA
jgi:transcription antitermination factor NusG